MTGRRKKEAGEKISGRVVKRKNGVETRRHRRSDRKMKETMADGAGRQKSGVYSGIRGAKIRVGKTERERW